MSLFQQSSTHVVPVPEYLSLGRSVDVDLSVLRSFSLSKSGVGKSSLIRQIFQIDREDSDVRSRSMHSRSWEVITSVHRLLLHQALGLVFRISNMNIVHRKIPIFDSTILKATKQAK